MAATATLSGAELNRIVFGTDFSPVAERAATDARGLALSFDASVDVVHVFDADVYLDEAEPRLRTLDDRLEARSVKLQAFAQRFVATGVRTKTELPMTRPGWSGLLKAAETDEADLIVVATRSKAQLKRVFVGIDGGGTDSACDAAGVDGGALRGGGWRGGTGFPADCLRDRVCARG